MVYAELQLPLWLGLRNASGCAGDMTKKGYNDNNIKSAHPFDHFKLNLTI